MKLAVLLATDIQLKQVMLEMHLKITLTVLMVKLIVHGSCIM